jgi:plasmid maintenance system antidote protein VapI
MTVLIEITAGELASILGVSERRVAALKAEGRIPTAGNGKVLLHALLGQQHAELAKARQQPHIAKRLASPFLGR